MSIDSKRAEVDPVKWLVADLEADPLLRPETMSVQGTRSRVDAVTCQDVVNRLRIHERDTGVRYVALPVEALERIRACWGAYSDEAFKDRSLELVRDLLDGQDGHLLSVDAVLER